VPTRRSAHPVRLVAIALASFSCAPRDALEPRGTLAMRVVSGDGQAAIAGTELAQPLVAQVLRDGAPVEEQVVNFRVTAGGGDVFAGVAITGADGIVQERWILGPVPGSPQRVEARAVDNRTGEPLTFAVFTATALPPGGGAELVFTIQPSSTTAGATIPPLQVTARDAQGNTLSEFTGDVRVAIGMNPSGGVLSGTTAVAAVAGVATFSNLRIDRSGTGYTLTATAPGLASANSDPFNITGDTGSNFALRFFGNGVNDIDRVKIRIDDPTNSNPGPPADVGATDFTIEFWMRARDAENGTGEVPCGTNSLAWILGNIIIDRDRHSQGRKFGISMAGGRIAFGVTGAVGNDLTICGTSRVDDDVWHHVAVTRARATGALQVFVDGVREAVTSSGPGGDVSYPDAGVPRDYCNTGPCTNSDPYLVIGAEKHDADPQQYPSFSGWIDEVRLSTVIRYGGNFTRPSTRFVPDANTAALYHFDAGTGNTILDSSGAPQGPSNGVRRLGGTPAGPQWVTSGAPTGMP
jgi:hypothetical protein